MYVDMWQQLEEAFWPESFKYWFYLRSLNKQYSA